LSAPINYKKELPEIEKIVEELRHYYENDSRPFAVAFSGGKDSSTVLDCVCKALLRVNNPTKPVYVSFSDTLLEMDNTIDNINENLESLEAFAKEHNLPIKIRRLKPIPEESYLYLMIGRGYAVPRRDYRWCTDRLKLRPQKRGLEELQSLHPEGFLSIVGTRRAESPERENRIKENTIDGMLKIDINDPKNNVLMPIEYMSERDVWTYLDSETLPWLDGVKLGKVYAEAGFEREDTECKTLQDGLVQYDKYEAGCGKSARYGCWLCSLLTEDKTLNALAKQYSYMQELEKFRNWLSSLRDGFWENRDLYNHKDHAKLIYNKDNHRFGMSNVGGYSIEFRSLILRKLLDTDNKTFPDREKHIITDEELQLIQEAWIEEGDIELTAYSILKEVQERILPLSEEAEKLLLFTKLSNLAFSQNAYLDKPENRLQGYFHGEMNNRFFAQFSKQLLDNVDGDVFKAKDFLLCLAGESVEGLNIDDAVKTAIKFPSFRYQFFPTKDEDKYIRTEHTNDEINIATQERLLRQGHIKLPDASEKNLFGYDEFDTYFSHLEQGYEAIEDDPNISLEQKMMYFDDWNRENGENIKKIRRANLLKGIDVNFGIENDDGSSGAFYYLDYEIDRKKMIIDAYYIFDGSEDYTHIATLFGNKNGKGRKNVDKNILFVSDEIEAKVGDELKHLLRYRNEELVVEQTSLRNKEKREDKKKELAKEAHARKIKA